MLVQFGADQILAEWKASAVCIGVFDGVHLGHRELVRVTNQAAREVRGPSIVVTFDRSPLCVLRPEACPPRVSPLEVNLDLLRELGVSAALVLRFDRALSEMSAEEFLESILRGKLKAERLVIGHDFAMGHGRVGTGAWLSERIPTQIVPPVVIEGERVSSTHIRRAIRQGSLADAAAWLGRPFSMRGIVCPGAMLGRELGFPTANVAGWLHQVTPPDGVFSGWAQVPSGKYRAAISLGNRPTVGGQERALEAYLLDYDDSDFYGVSIELEFESMLRAQRHFASVDELIAQMRIDVAEVRSRGEARRA